jgi:hypothetical protein
LTVPEPVIAVTGIRGHGLSLFGFSLFSLYVLPSSLTATTTTTGRDNRVAVSWSPWTTTTTTTPNPMTITMSFFRNFRCVFLFILLVVRLTRHRPRTTLDPTTTKCSLFFQVRGLELTDIYGLEMDNELGKCFFCFLFICTN